jgi:nitroimidazol reductase NimA-like FMN-containing flavoprotein (pyridoxamine 5'-phosphate oxidase superfamily)
MDDTLRSERTRVLRVPARARYDRATVDAILDEGLVAAVGFCQGDQPFVIPMAYARRGDQLLLHGARASRTLGQGADGVPLCVTVTLLDGIVLARSAFHHSLNYRSVVILGAAREITAVPEKQAALQAIVDHYLAGRSGEVRPPDDKELAATCVLALPIREASAKVRTGGPLDDERDLHQACWAGHLPLALIPSGPPIADGAQGPPPPALREYRRGKAPTPT